MQHSLTFDLSTTYNEKGPLVRSSLDVLLEAWRSDP